MRRPLPLFLALALGAGPAIAADPGTMQRKDGVRDAVTAPLEDLNLKQVDIPAVLRRAAESPYDTKSLGSCEAVAAEIGRLDEALGADLDEAPPPDKRSRARKLAAAAHDAAVAEARGRTQDLLPFRGWIRQITGAARHDKQVQAAIRAGGVRRGYLKGVGMRMNCAPPAAPSWFVPARLRSEAAPREDIGGLLGRLWRALVHWVQSWWPW